MKTKEKIKKNKKNILSFVFFSYYFTSIKQAKTFKTFPPLIFPSFLFAYPDTYLFLISNIIDIKTSFYTILNNKIIYIYIYLHISYVPKIHI